MPTSRISIVLEMVLIGIKFSQIRFLIQLHSLADLLETQLNAGKHHLRQFLNWLGLATRILQEINQDWKCYLLKDSLQFRKYISVSIMNAQRV